MKTSMNSTSTANRLALLFITLIVGLYSMVMPYIACNWQMTPSDATSTEFTLPVTGEKYGVKEEEELGQFSEQTKPLAALSTSVFNIIMDAFIMVRNWMLPICLLACVIAFVVARLPGMDPRSVGMANSTIWGCVFALVLAYGLPAIFNVFKSIGSGLANTTAGG